MSRLFCFLVAIFCFSQVSAQRLPIWELGLALGYAKVPYYRGSASGRDIYLPLPLGIFRGKKYQKNTSHGSWWMSRSRRAKIDLSVAANLPVPNEGEALARTGMPRLDAIIEFGPRLSYQLWKRSGHQVTVVLPFRWATSVALTRLGFQGWVLSPFLSYVYEMKGQNAWEFDVLAGPLYGSRDYHQYFYSVQSKHANQTRSSYEAKQGYSGSRLTIYAQKSFHRLWLSAFARYDILRDAVFEASPLVEKTNSLFGGFVIGWMFKKSPKSVSLVRN